MKHVGTWQRFDFKGFSFTPSQMTRWWYSCNYLTDRDGYLGMEFRPPIQKSKSTGFVSFEFKAPRAPSENFQAEASFSKDPSNRATNIKVIHDKAP